MQMGYTVGGIRIVPDACGAGQSFALVSFSSGEEAAQAIATLDGQLPENLGITISPPAVSDYDATPTEIWNTIITPAVSVTFKGAAQTPSDHIYMSGLNFWADDSAIQGLAAGLRMSVKWSKLFPD